VSLLYAIVFATRCRSNHHRLAVDALRRLKSPQAERWRDLFLHFHKEYLAGAKAPDEEFKDFKNHVLHVREGEWGGAIEACEEWQRRAVRALKAKDWTQAAWCAGVMSHYYVDPIQPFHTHQTEEENVIHRAVEWSFSKSYGEFQKIIETDLGGYPEIEAPSGADWLKQMVRAGAKASNPHYEAIVDHYDFEVGRKNPKAGLDQHLLDVIAGLVGHAVSGLAAILDRTIAEAGIKPPKVETNVQALLMTLDAPIHLVLGAMEDAGARREVAAQYEEFRRTGKVRKTLGEDDKAVRALHAHEVLKAPLSSLDAKWPREIGALAGQGAPARGKKAPARPTPRPAPTPQPVLKAERASEKVPEIAPEKVKAAPPKPEPQRAAIAEPAPAAKSETKPEAKPTARKDKATPPAPLGLDVDAPVVEAPSIGPKSAKRLEAVGIRTIADLLSVSPGVAAAMMNARHISAQTIHDWQCQAMLACAVPGLRSRDVQALVACGINDPDELALCDAGDVAAAISRWRDSDDGQRAFGTAPTPNAEDVARWIAAAKSIIAQPAGKSKSVA